MISAAEARSSIKIDNSLLLKSIEQKIETEITHAVANLKTSTTVNLDKHLELIGQEQIIKKMKDLGYNIKYNSGSQYNEGYYYFTINW